MAAIKVRGWVFRRRATETEAAALRREQLRVNTHEAKTHLSRLLKRVAAGEEVVIARAGTPVARLVPLEGAERTRELGFAREKIRVPDDFDAPLPPEILYAFHGDEQR